jgi:hypothetical protein
VKPISPNDVRRMVREHSAKHGQMKLWAELNGINPNHLSNFMQGWCAPPRDLLAVLGIVKVMVRVDELPPDGRHKDGEAWRRSSPASKRKRIEDESPMS